MGNIDAKRDWGHARDYVEMMWMMLQQDEPDDYVVATGETNTVRLFIETAFKVVGVAWRGEGVDEVGYDKANPARELVKIDPKYFRPTEVELLIGDPTKAKQKLGWTPKVSLEDGVQIMLDRIDLWRNAPVWNESSIAEATRDWFEYLSDSDTDPKAISQSGDD